MFGKSLVSGGTAALADLGVLYLLAEQAHWGHFAAVNVAFAVGIIVNFILQKFWTFEHRDLHTMHMQFLKFLLLAAGNMAVNAVGMALLVGALGFWYLGAQIVMLGSLACFNFLAYRRFIFRSHEEQTKP